MLLPEGPYDTVAGWVMAELGRLPQLDDTLTRPLPRVGEGDGQDHLFAFTVTELDGRRAARLRLERLGSPAAGVGIE